MVSVILSSCLIIREGTGGKTNEKRWFRGTDHPATLSSSGSVMDTRPPHPAVFSDENDHHHHTGMINMNLMNASTKEGLQRKIINKSYKVFSFWQHLPQSVPWLSGFQPSWKYPWTWLVPCWHWHSFHSDLLALFSEKYDQEHWSRYNVRIQMRCNDMHKGPFTYYVSRRRGEGG